MAKIRLYLAQTALKFARYICRNQFTQAVESITKSQAANQSIKYIRQEFKNQRLIICFDPTCTIRAPLRKLGQVYYCNKHFLKATQQEKVPA